MGAIFTIHHQRDFVVMLESALHMGLDPRDALVIDKEYMYSNRFRDRVDGHIRNGLGVSVVKYADLAAALEDFFDHLKHPPWRRAVLVDDGGYLLPSIRGRNELNLQFVLGVVEQTASGITALRPFLPDLRVPLFDVAESDLKQTVEAPGVALAGFRSLQALTPDVHWNGRRAIVAGYGRIGRALAHELSRSSIRVAVHDRSYAALVTAQEDGFAAFDSLTEAMLDWRPHVFLGATGRAGFGDEVFTNLREDCVFGSLTSRDYEFDKKFLSDLAMDERRVPGVGTAYTIDTTTGPRNALLLADGFPLNFWDSESMPNEQSDLVLAAMLLGAVEIVRRRDAFAEGTNRDLSNDIINRHDILRRYYELRREGPHLP